MTINVAGQPWFTPYAPNGMELAYATTTTMTVAAGSTPNSTFQNIITLPDAVTIDLAVVGAGGLDAGTVAASTKYNVYAIGSSQYFEVAPGSLSNAVNPYPGSALLSTAASPSLPANYDMYRYIGAIYTDGSSQIVEFRQSGKGTERVMMYDVAVAELAAGSSATYANIDVATSVPRAGLRAILSVTVTPTAPSDAVHIVPFDSAAGAGQVILDGSVAAVAQTVNGLVCQTGDNSTVPTLKYKVTGTASVSVQGYIDEL